MLKNCSNKITNDIMYEYEKQLIKTNVYHNENLTNCKMGNSDSSMIPSNNCANCLHNVCIDTNINVFHHTIRGVGLSPDSSYANTNAKGNTNVNSNVNQNIQLARPFVEVRPVYHCHADKSIPFPGTGHWPLYTVGFTNRFLPDTGGDTITQLVYIWDTDGKQGFYSWEQNNLNGNIKVYVCSDPQVGLLKILYYAMVPIGFHSTFNELEPKLAYESYVKDVCCYKNYGCSYTEHMQSVIDHLIDLQTNDQSPRGPHKSNIKTQSHDDIDIPSQLQATTHTVVRPSFRPHLSDAFNDVVV